MQLLINWFIKRGFEWQHIDFHHTKEKGTHIIATSDLNADQIVVKIPIASCLNMNTCHSKFSKFLHKNEIGGTLALTLVVWHESIRPNSEWRPYLKSLEVNQQVPIYQLFFPILSQQLNQPLESEKDFSLLLDKVQKSSLFAAIKGLSLEPLLREKAQLLIDDYQNLILPLIQSKPQFFNLKSSKCTFQTFQTFLEMSTKVESRCFYLSTESMIPFADLFNHSINESIHVETNDSDTESEPIDDNEFLEMKIIKSVENGEEVYNTYGKHDSNYIFMKYGFVEENFVNDLDAVLFTYQPLTIISELWNKVLEILSQEEVEKDLAEEDETTEQEISDFESVISEEELEEELIEENAPCIFYLNRNGAFEQEWFYFHALQLEKLDSDFNLDDFIEKTKSELNQKDSQLMITLNQLTRSEIQNRLKQLEGNMENVKKKIKLENQEFENSIKQLKKIEIEILNNALLNYK